MSQKYIKFIVVALVLSLLWKLFIDLVWEICTCTCISEFIAKFL